MKLKHFVEKLGGRPFKCYRNSEELVAVAPKIDDRPALVVNE